MITILAPMLGQAMINSFALVDEVSLKSDAVLQLYATADADSTVASLENNDDCCQVQCCEGDCICPGNMCAFTVYLDNYLDILALPTLNEPSFSLIAQRPNFIVSSLYRPPISTS